MVIRKFTKASKVKRGCNDTAGWATGKGGRMALDIVFMEHRISPSRTLRALVAAGHRIVAVYSQPPRPAGRRGPRPDAITRPPGRRRARHPVRTPLNFRNPEDVEAFRALGADCAVVVAYGLLLPEAVLAGTRLGAFNGHASLLPRWRGAATIQRAIMAVTAETGMMIMKMDKGLDTGPWR